MLQTKLGKYGTAAVFITLHVKVQVSHKERGVGAYQQQLPRSQSLTTDMGATDQII